MIAQAREIKEWKDKIEGVIDAWSEVIAKLSADPDNRCYQAEFMEKVGNLLIDKIPAF